MEVGTREFEADHLWLEINAGGCNKCLRREGQ